MLMKWIARIRLDCLSEKCDIWSAKTWHVRVKFKLGCFHYKQEYIRIISRADDSAQVLSSLLKFVSVFHFISYNYKGFKAFQ